MSWAAGHFNVAEVAGAVEVLQTPSSAEGSARLVHRADRARQTRLSAMTGMTRSVLAWYSAKLGMTAA